VTLQNRDTVFWYGDMTFLGHAIKLFSHKKVLVELTVLPSFSARDFEDKAEIAQKCFEVINSQYINIVT